MWVEKVPRRRDFCGCPPCPLCYDWADDDNPTIVVLGIIKYYSDMVGPRPPSPEEKQILDGVLEKVHVENQTRLQRIEREFAEADEARQAQMRVDFLLKETASAAARPPKPKRKTVRNKTLDEMDVEGRVRYERQRKEEGERLRASSVTLTWKKSEAPMFVGVFEEAGEVPDFENPRQMEEQIEKQRQAELKQQLIEKRRLQSAEIEMRRQLKERELVGAYSEYENCVGITTGSNIIWKK